MPKSKWFMLSNIALAVAGGGMVYYFRAESDAIVSALTVLIAFSPFGLVLGAQLIFERAARRLDELNIRMHSTEALINLCAVDTVAFSMNKMLTTGEYYITDLIPEGLTQAGLLSMAASAERNSTHPLGRKIFETAEARGLRLESAAMFNELEGLGVEALIGGTTVRVGRPDWIRREGASISALLRTKIDQVAAKARTPLVVSMGTRARGLIGLKDEVDERAKIFLERLKYNGLDTMLLTAEPKRKASSLTKDLPIDGVRAELLPEDKAREIKLMQARGRLVLSIGSTERDQPAFEAADVSILIGDEDLASADFVINDASDLFELRAIASRAKQLLRWNWRLAVASWLLMVPLVTLTLIDVNAIPYPPLLAALGVAIFATMSVFNARRH